MTEAADASTDGEGERGGGYHINIHIGKKKRRNGIFFFVPQWENLLLRHVQLHVKCTVTVAAFIETFAAHEKLVLDHASLSRQISACITTV